MNILHFSSAKTWRGGEQQLAYLVLELQKIGLSQIVFCVQNSALHHFCQTQNLPFQTYHKWTSINPFVGKRLQGICQKNKIDLVHTHDAHAHTFAYLSARLWRNPTPIVVSRRVDFPIKNKRSSHQKYNHPAIQKIICVSEAVRRIAAPSILDKNKLTVVHDGIALERFPFPKSDILHQEFGLASDTLLVGNVAAIAPHKDYFTFVDTAALLVQKGLRAHFFIIGADGGEEPQIRASIHQKGLDDKITLTGFRTDIPALLPALDVFLMTSKTEGLGTSILDAFACKVPVVATRAGGIPEIVLHKKTGLTAEVGAADALAHHVHAIALNPTLKNALTKGATQHLQAFTTKRMAEKTLKIYQALV